MLKRLPGRPSYAWWARASGILPGIAAKVFNALEGIRIRMISLGASRVNVGFVVDEGDLELAVRRLHATFFDEPRNPCGHLQ